MVNVLVNSDQSLGVPLVEVFADDETPKYLQEPTWAARSYGIFRVLQTARMLLIIIDAG